MYTYIVLVQCFAFCMSVLLVVSSQTIICDSPCSYGSKQMASYNQSDVCKVEVAEKIPYPDDKATTALNPIWQNYSWYTYSKANGEKAVAFNLTWTQNAYYVRKFVQGYFLSIIRISSTVNYLLVFKTTIPKTASDMVVVNYPCFGRSMGEEIDPGYCYMISLKAMPLYHASSDVLDKDIFLCIPDCEDDDEIYETDYCQVQASDYYKSDYDDYDDEIDFGVTTTTSTENTGEDASLKVEFILISLFVILLLVIITSLFVCYQRSKKVLTNSSVLVVVSTHGSEDRSYWDISANLANVLSKYSNLTLTLNVWELATNTDAVDWMAEKLQFHNHIVLVCSPLGKKNWVHGNKDDAFVLGLQKILHLKRKALLNLSPSHNYTVIYFDNDERTCIPEVLNKNGIKYLKIPEDLGKFYRKISGGKNGSFSKSDIADLNKLVFTLRSNGEKYYSANSRCDMTASVTDDENSRVNSAIVSMFASDSQGNTMSTDLCSEERESEVFL